MIGRHICWCCCWSCHVATVAVTVAVAVFAVFVVFADAPSRGPMPNACFQGFHGSCHMTCSRSFQCCLLPNRGGGVGGRGGAMMICIRIAASLAFRQDCQMLPGIIGSVSAECMPR